MPPTNEDTPNVGADAPSRATDPKILKLNDIKEKLFSALKSNAAAYWECMRKFVQFKLTKRELDIALKTLLPDEHGT